jgi:cell division septum initiation protein DivIVA
VPMIQDFLLRFRGVWAPPGPAAGQAGVPADRRADLDHELRDLSDALETTEREAQEIVGAGEAEANAIAEAAGSESVRIVEEARLSAPQVRAQRAAARIQDRRAEIDRLISAAEADAAAVQVRAGSRVQPLVELIVAGFFAAQPAAGEQHARVMGGG